MLTPESLPHLQACIAEIGADGWLLGDFQRGNPIAVEVLGLSGMLTRRHFGFVPKQGVPTAIIHGVEVWPWSRWPAGWGREHYVAWQDLDRVLARTVGGKQVAMEYYPGNAIPYLDRVSGGTLELVRRAGAEIVSSAELITRFYASWSAEQAASHRRTAEVIADLARRAAHLAGDRARDTAITEHGLRNWIVDALHHAGLSFEAPPMVAAGANSADVHYEPSPDRPRPVVPGDVLMIDLWAREPGGPYADQTWMASIGPPSPRVQQVWEAERAARDTAIEFLRRRVGAGDPVRGSEVHEAARQVLAARGYLEYAVGRAGHSIDGRHVHGAGPNLDCVETPDDRLLLTGTAFSIEPGLYLPGEFGMRSEVNAYLDGRGLVVTPGQPQTELLVV